MQSIPAWICFRVSAGAVCCGGVPGLRWMPCWNVAGSTPWRLRQSRNGARRFWNRCAAGPAGALPLGGAVAVVPPPGRLPGAWAFGNRGDVTVGRLGPALVAVLLLSSPPPPQPAKARAQPAIAVASAARPRGRRSRIGPTKRGRVPALVLQDHSELEHPDVADLVAGRVDLLDRDVVVLALAGRRAQLRHERRVTGRERAAIDAALEGDAGIVRAEGEPHLGDLVLGPDDSPSLLVLLLERPNLGPAGRRRRGRPGRSGGQLHRADVGAVLSVGDARVDRPRQTALVGRQVARGAALVHHRAVDRRQLGQRRAAVVSEAAELRIDPEEVRAGRRLGRRGVARVLHEAEREVERTRAGSRRALRAVQIPERLPEIVGPIR